MPVLPSASVRPLHSERLIWTHPDSGINLGGVLVMSQYFRTGESEGFAEGQD